jgi:hypothetical protein
MANYKGVIADNIARAGIPARAAHAKVQTTPSTGFNCTNMIIAGAGPGGTREVAPFEGGWICSVGQVLFDEFITSPSCAGRARCAMTQTLVYFAKHKTTLTPWDVAARWAIAIQFGLWGYDAVTEMFRMCAGVQGCLDTQGISPECQGPAAIGGGWQCISGTAYNMQIIDEYNTLVIDGSDVSNDYTVMGDSESAIEGYVGGYFSVGNDSYDNQFGYGSYGLMSEMGDMQDYGSCYNNPIPWCPG